MSNLNLPAMDYANLCKLANKGTKWVKIGYQTWVRRDEESDHVVKVKHHNSIIANVSETKTVFNNHGYHTKTTADRLNRIVFANTGLHIGITNYQMVVRNKYGEAPMNSGDNIIYNK